MILGRWPSELRGAQGGGTLKPFFFFFGLHAVLNCILKQRKIVNNNPLVVLRLLFCVFKSSLQHSHSALSGTLVGNLVLTSLKHVFGRSL